MKDLYNNVTLAAAQYPASISATGSVISVDRRGYDSVLACVNTGAMTTVDSSNYFSYTLVESDDGSTFTAVAAADIEGGSTNLIAKLDAAGDADKLFKLGYKGSKRYVGILPTETGTSVVIAGAFFILGDPADAPVA